MNNEKMKKLDMTCPRCAASMILDEKHEHAKCEYCGYHMILEKKENVEEIKKRQEAKSYGYHAGKYKAEEEARKRAARKSRLGTIIAIIIFVIIGCAGLLMQEYSKPMLEDPFEYLEVSFTGEDGDGELEMKVRNDAPEGIDMARVSFSSESKYDLTEGDIIVIEASCDDYRLGVTSKRYTVEGLELYLEDVSKLSEKQLEMIVESNKSIQNQNVELVLEEGETLQITPLHLICHKEGTANELYMISEVSFAVTDAKYYTISFWEDVIINNTTGTLGVSYGHYMGNLISVHSWRSAMLCESLDEALSIVESEQKSSTKVSALEIN